MTAISGDAAPVRAGGVSLVVCTRCRADGDDPAAPSAGTRLADAIAAENERRGRPCAVATADCLSVCKRPVSIAFSAPGRWTYVCGDIAATDPAAILDAAGQYGAAPEGIIPWRERPDFLKRGVVARIPPLDRT